ncbi:hypothetical protein [Quadrisphaera sp. DSM 44207]|uniref:hypothetical protein n=1 Tax=Quadrisphaera sp. DSM 44207 TaxID=1881057 RepID=UPI001C40B4CA|nr:hypothetical protein [Quadrisphaera sp. DSM 44207]
MRSRWAERPAAAVAGPGQRGSVTAELAVGLVGAVVAVALVLSVGLVAVAQVRAVAGAAAAARAAARGEGADGVAAAARAVAGPDAAVRTSTGSGGAGGGLVRVVVRRDVALLLPGAPRLAVAGTATALVETGPAPGAAA